MLSQPTESVSAKADTLLTALVGIAILAVYLATIYPGLLDIGDAAKFAFVGRVLGIPHAPGYPLYVVVSHVFGYLPIGTLAYRMNLLSATLGAITAALSYLIARRLGVRPIVAASTGLALGLGRSFWATSLYAKTYTLNAALVSMGALMLLRWNDRRRVSDLYWAIAIFSLSVGNHLTVIALVPALVLFTVLTDRRTALQPRTIAVTTLFVLMGLLQYVFIIVRTLQGAPYLEARATNLRELVYVMTARRFAHEIGAYTASSLISLRIPHIAGLIGAELGIAGMVFAAVGFAALSVRRPRHALLLGGGALGVASLTANMSSGEDQGFLLSVFVMLWPITAAGMDWTMTRLKLDTRRLGTVLAVCLAVLLPSVHVVANYGVNDHHAETFESDYFNALFAALPQKTVFIDDEYHINMLVLYKLVGEKAAGTRDIRLVRMDRTRIDRLLSGGFAVLAFQEGQHDLAQYGYTFSPFNIPATGRWLDAVHRRDVYRVASSPLCASIGNVGWVNLTNVLRARGRIAVKIDNYRAFDSTLTIYAGAHRALEPAVMAASGQGKPALESQVFATSDAEARQRLADAIAADHALMPEDLRRAPFVIRAKVRVNDGGDYSTFSLDIGGDVGAAIGAAAVDLDNPNRATVCTHGIVEPEIYAGGTHKTTIAPNVNDVQFDPGWHDAERRQDGLVSRWTRDRAVALVPLIEPKSTVITFEAAAVPYPNRPPGGGVTLIVNGRPLGRLPLPLQRMPLAWTAPAEVLREGLNELVLDVDGAVAPSNVSRSSDTRLLGLSVTKIEFAEAGAISP